MIQGAKAQGAALGGAAVGGMGSPLDVTMAHLDRNTIALVKDALHKGRLRLAYQPVILARDLKTVAFYEGLIRILDAAGRVIPARDFMDVVEGSELGRQIDCAALDIALKALAAHPALRLSVNMSARSIGYGPWKAVLARGLAAAPRVGERLILEISESSAMLVPEIVIAFMDEHQRDGIAIALDNFGAGQMAIRYFREFSFDIVKIDRQFVRGIEAEPDNRAIVAALIGMARHFGMFTVAEAVETPAEAGALVELGVDCVQGYLFGAPNMKVVF